MPAALFGVVVASACRSHVAVCETCSENASGAESSGDAGSAPASGGAPSEAGTRSHEPSGGDAGSGGEGGGAGCVLGMPCDPDFGAGSPWMLVASVDEVKGLPLSELGKRPLLALGAQERPGPLGGPEELEFSPDGRHALMRYLSRDLLYQVLELSFVGGVPDPLHNVVNLPRFGSYNFLRFSPDGSRALVIGDGEYLLDLSGRDAVPSLPGDVSDVSRSVGFCADASLFAQGDSALLAELAELGSDVVLAPSAKIAVLPGLGKLAACASAGGSAELGLPYSIEVASFSPGSTRLAIEDDDGVLHLLAVEGLRVDELWQGPDVNVTDWTSEDLPVVTLSDDDGDHYGFIDLAAAEPKLALLPFPEDTSLIGCDEAGCAALLPGAGGDLQLVRQSLSAPSQRAVLADEIPEDASVRVDLARRTLLLTRWQGDGGALAFRAFGASGNDERALFEWPKADTVITDLAPDGSGLVVTLIIDSMVSASYWVPLPGADDAAAVAVPLDFPASLVRFQPRP